MEDSPDQHSDFFRGKTHLWADWFRQPELEIAEAVIRLRRARGLTQAALARKMGTKQPAIARIEAGEDNLTLAVVTRLAKCLDATILVSLEPVELIGHRKAFARWWDRGVTHCGIHEQPEPKKGKETIVQETLVLATQESPEAGTWELYGWRGTRVQDATGKIHHSPIEHVTGTVKGDPTRVAFTLPLQQGDEGDIFEYFHGKT